MAINSRLIANTALAVTYCKCFEGQPRPLVPLFHYTLRSIFPSSRCVSVSCQASWATYTAASAGTSTSSSCATTNPLAASCSPCPSWPSRTGPEKAASWTRCLTFTSLSRERHLCFDQSPAKCSRAALTRSVSFAPLAALLFNIFIY